MKRSNQRIKLLQKKMKSVSPLKYCGMASNTRTNTRRTISPVLRNEDTRILDIQTVPEFYTEVFCWGSDLNG